MTTYGAYDAGLPCKNKSCKSHGVPHPNCQCYGDDMAEGGEAKPFCSKVRAHQKGCEYFADGGDTLVPDGPIMDPEPELVPDAPIVDPEPSDELVPDGPIMDPEPMAPEGDDANINLSPADLQAKMIAAAHPNGISSYETPNQQLATVAEGAAQGIAGPLATLAETKLLGVDPEDIKARQAANPGEHGLAEAGAFAGSMLGGVGEAKLIGKAAEMAGKIAQYGSKGRGAIKGAVELGLIHGSDEASKAILGQGPPEDAVNPYLAHGAPLLFGALMGGAGAYLANKAVRAVEGPLFKRIESAQHFLAGAGMKAEGMALPKAATDAMKAGHKFIDEAIGGAAGEEIGRKIGKKAGMYVPIVGKPIGVRVGQTVGKKLLQPLLGGVADKFGEYTVPTVVRWLQNGANGSIFNMLDYAKKVHEGTSLINNSVEALFTGAASQAPAVAAGELDKLRAYSDNGGFDASVREENEGQHESEQSFAEGGDVKAKPKKASIHDDHAHIAENMPDQNHLIQTAKARISGYLSSMRPQQHAPKLAFDDHPDDRQQKKDYGKALEIAANPLGVLGHVGSGTIDPDHLKHLSAMYPELTGHLQKKITERIVKDQMDDKKPSFKVRQGLSLFMGTPMSGEFTPQSIQAAQAVFSTDAKQRQKDEPEASPSKGSKAALSKSERAYLTDDQARMARQQRAT